MSIHAWSHLSSWILPIQVKTIEGMFWEKFNYWIYERFPWLFSFRHCRVFLSTLVPTPNCQHDLQFWILLLQSNCSFVRTLKIHSFNTFQYSSIHLLWCPPLCPVTWWSGCQAPGRRSCRWGGCRRMGRCWWHWSWMGRACRQTRRRNSKRS